MKKLIVIIHFLSFLITSKAFGVAVVVRDCAKVDAKKGLQNLTFRHPIYEIEKVYGKWTVDKLNYAGVGASGHTGSDAQRLAPYNQYKKDQNYPFGALLLKGKQGFIHIDGPMMIPSNQQPISGNFQINDTAFSDNDGSLTVCFTYGSSVSNFSVPLALYEKSGGILPPADNSYNTCRQSLNTVAQNRDDQLDQCLRDASYIKNLRNYGQYSDDEFVGTKTFEFLKNVVLKTEEVQNSAQVDWRRNNQLNMQRSIENLYIYNRDPQPPITCFAGLGNELDDHAKKYNQLMRCLHQYSSLSKP